MGSSDLGPTMNETVLELSEERKRMEGEGSTALQNANEAEVILLYIELNVLKGPSRDDYSKLFSENATETLLHGAHSTMYLHAGRLTHGWIYVNSGGIPSKGGMVINFGNKDWVWMYKGMLCIGLDSKGDGWDGCATLMVVSPCPKACHAMQSLQSHLRKFMKSHFWPQY